MNTPVALPIVDALPVAAPAMPLAIAEPAPQDAELVQAAHGLEAADKALGDLHDKFGDDADSRADWAVVRKRNDNIPTLIVVPALSAAGVDSARRV